MPTDGVSTALRDRLGREGTLGLVELLESEETAWRDRVLSIAAERYERRLAEEMASLLEDMTKAGVLLDTGGLRPVAEATRVRLANATKARLYRSHEVRRQAGAVLFVVPGNRRKEVELRRIIDRERSHLLRALP